MNKIKENIKDKKILIFSVCIFLFVILTYTVFNKKINILDTTVESFILGIRNNSFTNIMVIITNISSAYALLVISIILLVVIKKKHIPISIFINLLSVFLVSQLAKVIIQRPRPNGINLVDATGYSYPSGHSMVSMAYFGFVTYLIYKNINNKLLKTFLIILSFIIIVLIGFSRVYLGVHYISDVIGGFLLSISYLMLFIIFINFNKGVK